MEAQENLKSIKLYMDAIIGLHTRHERGGLTKANLTTEIVNMTQKICEKTENVEKHIKKSAEEIKKKDNKIKELQKYNSTLSTKLTQMKNERNSLQQTLDEAFGETSFPDSGSQVSSVDNKSSGVTETQGSASDASLPLSPPSLFSAASSCKTPESTEPGPSKCSDDSQEDIFEDPKSKKQKLL